MNLYETDAEFMKRFERFAYKEIVSRNGKQLDDETRYMAVIASLIGCQGIDTYKMVLPKALDGGLSAAVVKEIVYQAVDYLGMGRILPFLAATNVILEERGVRLPLPEPKIPEDTLLEKNMQEQERIFGEQMKELWRDDDIHKWLVENCFGDYYSSALSMQKREILAFCFLMAPGGCEKQLAAHVEANIKLGNDKEVLISVVAQCLPYIGYPRSLNAVACVREAGSKE